MKILAIDTSSSSGSIAVLDGPGLMAELTVSYVGTHSEWLLASIDRLLKDSGLDISDIGLFAIGKGPGSFTGLRIGVAAIKGLAWPLGRKVAGVSTLKALALNLRYSNMTVCPVLDARKGEVYTALFRYINDRMETVLDETAISPRALIQVINEEASARPVVFLGNGLNTYLDTFKTCVKTTVFAPEPLWHIKASNIGLLALEEAASAVFAGDLSPAYLRKSEAEIKAGKKG